MAYRYSAKSSIRKNVRRIVREQIDRAIEELHDQNLTRDQRIHQARKRFKRVRAVLRLLREELGEVYEWENAWFRDAGRDLSRIRDAQAMVETCERLMELHRLTRDEPILARLHQLLVERRERVVGESTESGNGVSQLTASLRDARDRVRSWHLPNDDFELLAAGLGRVYRQTRRLYRMAYVEPTPEHFHEWRKRVKDSWHHMELFQNAWPDVLKGRTRSLHALSDILGEHQDLHVLRISLHQEPALQLESEDLERLLALMDLRIAELRARAETLGMRLFAHKPSTFLGVMRDYWGAWVADLRRS